MSSRRVVFWRHGRTQWNTAGRFQGQLDVELDATGVEQAQQAAKLLARLEPAAIVSSDLSRAARTAAALGDLTGLGVDLDPALRETYAGAWQGMVREDITATFPAEWAAWGDGADVRPGGDGETRIEVADRVVTSIERRLAALDSGATLVVVTHGGSARVAIGRLIGLPPEHWTALGVLSNCAWSVLTEGQSRFRLIEYNAGSLPVAPLTDDR